MSGDRSSSAEPAAFVHPLTGSPDRAALAEFDAGLPDEAATALASAHVEHCPDCQAVLSGLRATRADLGRLAGTPMPASVADRVARALAAERRTSEAERRTTKADRPAPASEPADGDRGRHRAAKVIELRSARRVHRLRVAAGLAAGLVLLGGGGYLVGGITSGSDEAATSADGGSRAESVEDSAAGGLPSYDRQSLEAAVGELLASNSPATPEEGGAAETAVTAAGEATSVDPDCLASIPVATAQALSITRALYDSRPVIVLLLAGDPGQVQVTVVSDCSEGAEPAVVEEFQVPR